MTFVSVLMSDVTKMLLVMMIGCRCACLKSYVFLLHFDADVSNAGANDGKPVCAERFDAISPHSSIVKNMLCGIRS